MEGLDSRNIVATEEFVKTPHFVERQSQRHIPDARIALALRFGQTFYQGTERVFFLGRKQLLRAQRALGSTLDADEARRADGTVVVVGGDNALVTTYRNPNYIRHLRRCEA